MSDLLAAAAAALGIPEPLAQRSAEARAAETGSSVDDVLAAWAGDEPTPVQPTAVTEAPAPQPTPEPEEAAPVAPTVEIPVPTAPEPAPAPPAGPYKPPVLVGVKDSPVTVLVSAVGLFLVIALIGLIGPASGGDEPGSRSSAVPYTQSALDGQGIYGSLGCASCHTQMVRPLVADVGLGPVTLNDSNQVLGSRRFGPDLSNVGSRVSRGQIEAIVGGLDGHPAHELSLQDLAALADYLSQSSTEGSGR